MVPGGEITEKNAQAMYREGERMMVWPLVAFGIVYLGIVMDIVAETGSAVVVLGLVGLGAATLGGLVRMVIVETPT